MKNSDIPCKSSSPAVCPSKKGAVTKTFWLAWSLVQVPRIFTMLFLFPLFISIFSSVFLIWFSAGTNSMFEDKTDKIKQRAEETRNRSYIRKFFYGQFESFETLQICTKSVFPKLQTLKPGIELKDCKTPSNNSLAIQVNTYDLQTEKLLNSLLGTIPSASLCIAPEKCSAQIRFIQDPITHTYKLEVDGIENYILSSSFRFSEEKLSKVLKLADELDDFKAIIPDPTLYLTGLSEPIDSKQSGKKMIIVVNILALLVLVGWCLFVGYRKVLEYFARSGALLPLVSASGYGVFYGTLWTLVFIRTAIFLSVSVPVVIGGLFMINKTGIGSMLYSFPDEFLRFGIWLLATISGILLITFLTAVSDAKRHISLRSIIFKYIPLLLFILGSTVWLVTLTADIALIRNWIRVIPVFSLLSIFFDPMIKEQNPIPLYLHCLGNFVIFYYVFKRNLCWFSYHVEDI